jgi:transposase-like protein
MMAGFMDVFTCPKGHRRAVYRMGKSAGKIVQNYCTTCDKQYKSKAGFPRKRHDAAGGRE